MYMMLRMILSLEVHVVVAWRWQIVVVRSTNDYVSKGLEMKEGAEENVNHTRGF